jgi:hypothetical protein
MDGTFNQAQSTLPQAGKQPGMRRANYPRGCLGSFARKNGSALYRGRRARYRRYREAPVGYRRYQTISNRIPAELALDRLRLTSGSGHDAGKSRPLDRPLHSRVISLSHPRRNSKENCFG